MKKYTIFIEQPCTRSMDIEAVDIESAMEQAKEKYNNDTILFREEDFGTDPQIMAEEIGGSGESTEWTDF